MIVLEHPRYVAGVRRPVGFYVQQFNEVMLHSALMGRTLDEVHFGQGTDVPIDLAVARKAA